MVTIHGWKQQLGTCDAVFRCYAAPFAAMPSAPG